MDHAVHTLVGISNHSRHYCMTCFLNMYNRCNIVWLWQTAKHCQIIKYTNELVKRQRLLCVIG